MFRILATSIFALSLLSGISGCSETKTAEEHIAYAKSFQERGDFETAVVEWKNALRLSPDNIEARWNIASIYLQTGDGEGAEKEIRRCADLGMDQNELVVSLMEAQMLQHKYAETLETLVDEPSLTPDVMRKVWLLRGEAYLNLKELTKAEQAFDAAMEIDKNDPDAGLGKARVAAHLDSIRDARKWIDKVLEAHPDHAPTWSFLGKLEQFEQNSEAAENAYTNALKARPNNVSDLANRALMRIFQDKLKSAAADMQAARRANASLPTKEPMVFYVQGQLSLKRDKVELAAAAFENMLAAAPNYLPARYFLALSHYKMGNIEQAEQNLGIFRARAPQYAAGHRLYAALKFSQGDYKEARRQLDNILAFYPEDSWALSLLSDLSVLEGNPEESVANYRKLVEMDPDSENAHLKLALALMQSDQAEARKQLAQASSINPNASQPRLLIVASYINSSDWDNAIIEAEEVIAEQPGNWDAYTLLGGAYLGKGQPEKARPQFVKALEIKPGNPNAATNLARMEMAAGNTAAARLLHEQVLKHNSDNVSSILALADLDRAEGNIAGAISRLESASESNPDSVDIKLALGNFYLATGAPSRNLSVFLDESGRYDNDPRVQDLLGSSQLALGQTGSAIASMKRLVELRPKDPDAHHQLARAYLVDNKLDLARQQWRKVLQLDPTHFGASIMQVRLLRKSNQLDEAVKMLARVDPVYANRPETLVETGWLSLYQKDYKRAVSSFERAFAAAPSTFLAIQLGVARWNAGNQKAALKGYREWLDDNPGDIQVLYHLGNGYMQRGENRQAVSTYKRLLEEKPDDVIIMNNVAWLLRSENPAEARTWADKVVAAAPEWAPGLDTLGMLQFDAGNLSEAYRIFEKAVSNAPSNPELRYHLAMAGSQMGERRQAERILKAILSDKGEFNGRKEAEQLLKRLQSGR